MRQPQPNDRYQDKSGQYVTVKTNVFHRITFVRDGYSAECVYPDSRFLSEFALVQGGHDEVSA